MKVNFWTGLPLIEKSKPENLTKYVVNIIKV